MLRDIGLPIRSLGPHLSGDIPAGPLSRLAQESGSSFLWRGHGDATSCVEEGRESWEVGVYRCILTRCWGDWLCSFFHRFAGGSQI